MHLDKTLKDYLTKANLYGLLAKRYEYVDPQKHMHFYQKHFKYVQLVEKHFLMLESKNAYKNAYHHGMHDYEGLMQNPYMMY